MINKRVEVNDATAINDLGSAYREGTGMMGLQRNYKKANKLFLRAGELGCAHAYKNLAVAYRQGEGVERDLKKGEYYYALAAMGGNLTARYNLGLFEAREGNADRAVKHWMIGAEAGDDQCMTAIRDCFLMGHGATKDIFEKALRAHKKATDEMKSEQREAARGKSNLLTGLLTGN